MGGSMRLFVTESMAALGTSFEFVSVRLDETDNIGMIVPNNSASTLRIEKLVYRLG